VVPDRMSRSCAYETVAEGRATVEVSIGAYAASGCAASPYTVEVTRWRETAANYMCAWQVGPDPEAGLRRPVLRQLQAAPERLLGLDEKHSAGLLYHR